MVSAFGKLMNHGISVRSSLMLNWTVGENSPIQKLRTLLAKSFQHYYTTVNLQCCKILFSTSRRETLICPWQNNIGCCSVICSETQLLASAESFVFFELYNKHLSKILPDICYEQQHLISVFFLGKVYHHSCECHYWVIHKCFRIEKVIL